MIYLGIEEIFPVAKEYDRIKALIKGIIVGLGLGAGVAMMLEEGMMNKNVIMKKGKQIAKKMGI